MKTALKNIRFEVLDLLNVESLTPQDEVHQSTPGEDIVTPIDPTPYVKPGISIVARGDYTVDNLTRADIVLGFIGVQVSPFANDLMFITRPQISGVLVNLNWRLRDSLKAQLVSEVILRNGAENSFFFLFDTKVYAARVPLLDSNRLGAGASYGHELDGTAAKAPIMENLQTGLIEDSIPTETLVVPGTRFGWPTRIEHAFTIIANDTAYGVVREDQLPQVLNRDAVKIAVENSLKMEQKLAIQEMIGRVPKSRFRRDGYDKDTVKFVGRWRFTHKDNAKGLKF